VHTSTTYIGASSSLLGAASSSVSDDWESVRLLANKGQWEIYADASFISKDDSWQKRRVLLGKITDCAQVE
jgi:hypothetical protein